MALARTMKRRARELGPAVVFFALTVYFAWNSTQGELGLQAFARRNADLVSAQGARDAAIADQQEWRARVAAMQSDHLDTDAIDERARQMLNFSTPSDVIVPLKH